MRVKVWLGWGTWKMLDRRSWYTLSSTLSPLTPLSIWAISTGSSDFHSARNAFCGTACYRSGQQQGQRGSNLVDGRFLREHGVKQDGVGEIVDADVVLERDLQLSGSGAGRLCLREGGE